MNKDASKFEAIRQKISFLAKFKVLTIQKQPPEQLRKQPKAIESKESEKKTEYNLESSCRL
jgi:hypothetical protein